MKRARGPGAARLETALRAIAGEHHVLRLFVSGNTTRSRRAVEAIQAICERYLAGRYELEVVDLHQSPERARAAKVVATPTLVRERPQPKRFVIRGLAEPDRILLALDIRPPQQPS